MRLFLSSCLLVWGCTTVQASTIAQSTGGTTSGSGTVFWGQEFTTPSGGPWDDITINFLSDTGTTPTAAGTGYIFTSQYNGPPSGLSSSGFSPNPLGCRSLAMSLLPPSHSNPTPSISCTRMRS
jgi:hypothetical protein